MRRPDLRQVLTICLLTCIPALIAGCSNGGYPGDSTNSAGPMMGGNAPNSTGNGAGQGGGMMGGASSSSTSYSSDGQRVYLTGVGASGQSIPRSTARVAQGSMMMRGGGCGSCHGANGRGGTIRMTTGTAIKAPDIRYAELIKDGFTNATIRAAIRDGLDEAGKPLDAAMPRWQMSAADLAATIAYLKVLGAQ
jgi:cytochrome c oxidase subunit II